MALSTRKLRDPEVDVDESEFLWLTGGVETVGGYLSYVAVSFLICATLGTSYIVFIPSVLDFFLAPGGLLDTPNAHYFKYVIAPKIGDFIFYFIVFLIPMAVVMILKAEFKGPKTEEEIEKEIQEGIDDFVRQQQERYKKKYG